MALAKANRLKARSDFQAVFQAGIRHKSSHLTLRALPMQQSMLITPTAELTPAKLGISVSTKVSKRAVIRNRIKRQIRAAFRSLLPQVAPGWRILIVVQPRAVAEKCDYQQFLQELEQLLTKAEAIDGHS